MLIIIVEFNIQSIIKVLITITNLKTLLNTRNGVSKVLHRAFTSHRQFEPLYSLLKVLRYKRKIYAQKIGF